MQEPKATAVVPSATYHDLDELYGDLETAVGALRGYINSVQVRAGARGPADQDRDDLITMVEDVLPGRFTAVLARIDERLTALHLAFYPAPAVPASPPALATSARERKYYRAALVAVNKAVALAKARKPAARRRAT